MVGYYLKTELMRKMRFVKRGFIATKNRMQGETNAAPLIGYKKQYSPCTGINEYAMGMAFYGLSAAVKRYAGYKGIISGIVEHGLYLGANLHEIDTINLPCVFTFSEYRRQLLRTATDRPVFQIGPYIQYVKAIEDTAPMKKSLGKTMLVFPVHTFESTSVEYRVDDFVDFILKIKEQMDIQTVLVSVYFCDIQKMAPIYESLGFSVVCSGHRTDKEFLPRQKAYLELADVIVTNSVGTHLGYAVSMNKPVCLFCQKLDYEYANKQAEEMESGDAHYYTAEQEIIEAFQGIHYEISPEQILVVEKYWGLSKVRSPEDLKLMLEAAEFVLQKTSVSNKSYKDMFVEYAQKRNDSRICELIMEALQ